MYVYNYENSQKRDKFGFLCLFSVLYNLKVRFEERNIIYTYCGKFCMYIRIDK
jgi:hypothetical protein